VNDDLDFAIKLAGCSLATTPGKDNWVDDQGGLPEYICEIARAIKKTGKTTSQAIAIAVSRCKKWAAGGSDVDAKTRAKAAAAVAEWEKKKAAAHAKNVKLARRDHTTGPLAGTEYILLASPSISSYSMDRIREAFNSKERARRDLIDQANAALRAATGTISSYPTTIDNDYRYVREVWTDFLIVEDGKSPQGFIKVPYTVSDDGVISWGTETPAMQEYVDVSASNPSAASSPISGALGRVIALAAAGKDDKPYGDVKYADEKNNKYPIDTAAHVKAAWSYINMSKNQKDYSADELASIKAAIKKAAKKFDIEISDDKTKLSNVLALSAGRPTGGLNRITTAHAAPAAVHAALATPVPSDSNLVDK
jgi:hypothetical protein